MSSEKKFKMRMSELSPAVKSSQQTTQRLLSRRLSILDQERRTMRRHHAENYHSVLHDLRFNIKPHSVPLDDLIIPIKTEVPKPKAQEELKVVTWIPGMGQTCKTTVRETGMGRRVFSVVRHREVAYHGDLDD